MIKRDDYVNKLISLIGNRHIKVITGIRRSGKSVLLFELFYDYLITKGIKDKNIIKIELDKAKDYEYRNPLELYNYIKEAMDMNVEEKYFLFIDEIQMARVHTIKKKDYKDEVTIFDVLNELKDYKNLDVYVTGSNSKMLSSDIVSEFRGRSSQIHVYPFSFKEFYSFKKGDINKALNEYMLYGGLPRLIEIENIEEKMDYLKNLFKEVYLKDLIERKKITKEDILNNLLDLLSSSISSLTNPNKIANILTSINKEKIDSNLINKYIEHLKDVFLINEAKRFDIKGKKYFEYPNKYYFIDVGLRNARLNFRQFDQGHIMENIIYNELIKRGYSVDIGVVYDRKNNNNTPKEIDFVVNYNDKKIYIQSAFEIGDEEKLDSETSSFKLTNDFFKKIVIRDDIMHNYYDENGFFHCNLIDFLLDKVNLF